eukprot:5758351-Pleurochrysis_carterae.AAC.1
MAGVEWRAAAGVQHGGCGRCATTWLREGLREGITRRDRGKRARRAVLRMGRGAAVGCESRMNAAADLAPLGMLRGCFRVCSARLDAFAVLGSVRLVVGHAQPVRPVLLVQIPATKEAGHASADTAHIGRTKQTARKCQTRKRKQG